MLPFEEVVQALGRRGERRLGLQTIPLDSIVGTVDRGREFDRRFRPTSSKVRGRWERIATAMRRGESLPPIDVYRIGDLHFVKDGHHRVSVARALGHDVIDAYVTEVQTEIGHRTRHPLEATSRSRATSGSSTSASRCRARPGYGYSRPTPPPTPRSPRASRPGASESCRAAASS